MKNKVLKSIADVESYLKKNHSAIVNDFEVYEKKFEINVSPKSEALNKQDNSTKHSDLFCDDDYKKVWSKALNILNRRDHSINELKGKLFDRELPARQIYAVIDELQRLNFLNDENFAEMYTEDLLRRGYGAMRIKNYLFKKRLNADLITNIVEKIDVSEQIQAAVKLIENKLRGGFRHEKDPFKLQQKLTRHLVGKGFTFDVIKCALEETIKKDKN